jgi:NhaA family Na+:H+ antiporter
VNDRPSFDDLPKSATVGRTGFQHSSANLHVEAVSGGALLIAAAGALIWANSPVASSYHAFWNLPIAVGVGEYVFSRPLHFWVNDALMTGRA